MAENKNDTVCSVCKDKTTNIDSNPLTGETVCICSDCLDQIYEQLSGEDSYIED